MAADVIEQQGHFMCELASAMLASGAPTVRVERSLRNVADAWGIAVEFDILPTNIILTVSEGNTTRTLVGPTAIGRINLELVSRLYRMSATIAERGLTVRAARLLMGCAVARSPIGRRKVVPLVGLANAGFCGIFGGDVVSLAIVFVATMMGFALKQWLERRNVDYRLATILSGCVASVLSASGYLMDFCTTPDVALATSVLYLVPGIPLANSVSDLLYGHYVCAFSRFCHAMMITISLSLGLSLGLLIVDSYL